MTTDMQGELAVILTQYREDEESYTSEAIDAIGDIFDAHIAELRAENERLKARKVTGEMIVEAYGLWATSAGPCSTCIDTGINCDCEQCEKNGIAVELNKMMEG